MCVCVCWETFSAQCLRIEVNHLALTFTLSATPSTTNVAEDLQSETVCRVHPHKTAGRNKLESWLESVSCVAQLQETKTLRTTLWFEAVARVNPATEGEYHLQCLKSALQSWRRKRLQLQSEAQLAAQARGRRVFFLLSARCGTVLRTKHLFIVASEPIAGRSFKATRQSIATRMKSVATSMLVLRANDDPETLTTTGLLVL